MTPFTWMVGTLLALILITIMWSLLFIVVHGSRLEKGQDFRWHVYDLEHELMAPPYDHDVRHCAKCWWASGRRSGFPNQRRRG